VAVAVEAAVRRASHVSPEPKSHPQVRKPRRSSRRRTTRASCARRPTSSSTGHSTVR
jgi:hypothetical protein